MSAALAAVWRSPTGRIGFALVVLVLLFSLLGPAAIPYEPNRLDVLHRFADPSPVHWMGTDNLGRDLAARMAVGGQIALGVALSTIALSLVFGILLGIAAAYAPVQIERVVLILFDVLSAFPTLIFALAIVALLGPGLDKVVLIIAVTLVPHFGRIARAQTLALKHAPFLDATRVLGASPARLVLVHVIPNILGPLVVLASMDIPVVITLEAGLSFLGIGVPPPRASWGGLLHDGYVGLTQSPWPVAFAGLMLTLATLGFTLFGEALRDAIDPKLRASP